MKPFRKCSCRDPETGQLVGPSCLKLGQKGHGSWHVRYEAPRSGDGPRRRPYLGPFTTKRAAEEPRDEAIGLIRQGAHVEDRRLTFGDYLARRLRWWESEAEIRPRTLDSAGLGHVKLGDLREHHFRELYAAMRLINRDDDVPAASAEMLRRLLEARARVPRVPERLASSRPLSDARIRRLHAVASSALSDPVPRTLRANPAAGVKIDGRRARKARPMLWTAARVERWKATGEVPSRVMVWSAGQCGAFLDAAEDERLYALFHLAAYYGLRRGELTGLKWADVDLASRRLHVWGEVKTEDSERILVIDSQTVRVLSAWRKVQLAECVAWGPAWTDSARVFTREDGSALTPSWPSRRFNDLVRQAGLPPVTFHGLRHGAPTMLLAAGQPIKVISETLGHSTSAFTADVYAEAAEELAEAAADAIAAYIPRAGRSPAR